MLKFLPILAMCLLFGCSTRQSPAPVIDVNSAIKVDSRTKDSIKSSKHIVEKGETLYSISWRSNVDIRTIADINNLKPPYKIYPGQKLSLVKKTAQATTSKTSVEKPIKNSKNKSENISKIPVATTSKQAYGENVADNESSSDPLSNDTVFSQKIDEWQWPANGKVIATFSDTINGNKGIDIEGRKGDRVKATADGKVVYAGNALRGYGKLIIVKHNDDYLSAYAHNDQILVTEQQSVKAGDIIAKMGDTDAQRVMLHFEVRFRGKSVNPLKYLPKK